MNDSSIHHLSTIYQCIHCPSVIPPSIHPSIYHVSLPSSLPPSLFEASASPPPGRCLPASVTVASCLWLLQLRGGGDGGGPEHACGPAHRPGAVRRPGPQEVAVRRLVQRRHAGKRDGSWRTSWVHYNIRLVFLNRQAITMKEKKSFEEVFELSRGSGLSDLHH